VDALFQSEEFIGNPKKIAKYAKYALRDDGPSVWGIPAPAGVKRGEAGYTVSSSCVSTSLFIYLFFRRPRTCLHLIISSRSMLRLSSLQREASTTMVMQAPHLPFP
jgi:hypothetical protein